MTDSPDDTKSSVLKIPGFSPSNLPATSVGGWSCGVAQGVLFRQYKKSHDKALGTPAFVTRANRTKMDPKDLEKLVKSMLTPFAADKFDKIDKVSTESLDIERIQSSASVAHMLAKVRSHFTSYDLGLAFTHFPLVDFSMSEPTWDLTTTINLFESYDQITPEVAADTVAFMRESLLDDELPKELSWTHDFLLSCCESASGETSLARIVSGQADCYMSVDALHVGGPLTLILILQQISSSSEKAIQSLKDSVPKINISTIPGENIDQLCNSLSYVLRRLDTSTMSSLSLDLLKVMQTTSHPDFNTVFRSWHDFVLLKIAPSPTWDAIFIRAREVFEEHADTWVSDTSNDGDAAFAATSEFKTKNGKKGRGTRTKDGDSEDWKSNPWYLFPNAEKGDVCTTTEDGTKCWSKKIGGKPVKWCGKCFSTKFKRKGMWTSSNAHLHFTHQHDAKYPRDGGAHANLATDRTPVDDYPDVPSEPSAEVRPGVSFSDALQEAAEGS